jgi:hypothetical protein
MYASGAQSMLHSQPEYYHTLLQSKEYPNPSFPQIKLDVTRTFTEQKCINEAQWATSLGNILTAYTHRNPTLGYCQGLNFIVGTLLQQIGNEEKVFWMLAMLIETILPIDYYCSITGVMTDFKVFCELTKEIHPELYTHMCKNKAEASSFAFQWFICIFTISLSKAAIYRIWDILFLKGNKTVFIVGLVILELISKKILQCAEPSTILISANIFND